MKKQELFKQSPLPANSFGRLPPQAVELEETILGALMVESEAYSRIEDMLKPECFYKVANQKIFLAIQTLARNNEPIDMHTVVDQLRRNGTIDDVGGAYCITMLTTSVSSAHHLEYHSQIIHQKYVAREMIRITSEVQEMAYNDQIDIEETIAHANKCLSSISSFSENSILKMDEALDLMIQNCEKNSLAETSSSGSRIGFHEFDKRSGGLQKSDLIIIGAESSQGKTSMALSMVNNISNNGGKVAIYSMEMRAVQLAARFTAYASGIPANEILYGKFDNAKFQKLDGSIGKLIDSEIYIDEKSTSKLDSIVSSIRWMVKNYGIDGAVIDYIQLVDAIGQGINKEQQTALIARTFKNVAKDLDIWIVALSQLARDPSNPVPSIKRLRDSGQIEEAADIVMLIYRPEQVGRNVFPEPFENESTDRAAMIDIAKGRNIGTFKFLASFDKPTTHFAERTFTDFSNMAYQPFKKSLTDKPF